MSPLQQKIKCSKQSFKFINCSTHNQTKHNKVVKQVTLLSYSKAKHRKIFNFWILFLSLFLALIKKISFLHSVVWDIQVYDLEKPHLIISHW